LESSKLDAPGVANRLWSRGCDVHAYARTREAAIQAAAILEAPQYHVSPLGEAYGDTRNFD
jgi:hypothetical protein